MQDLGLPVKFIGVGEQISDLRDFEPEPFVDALLGNDPDSAQRLRDRANKMLGSPEEGGSSEGSLQSAGRGPSTAASRLQQSFAASKSGGGGDSGNEIISPEDLAMGMTGGGGGGGADKKKRKARPKPQGKKKKKSK